MSCRVTPFGCYAACFAQNANTYPSYLAAKSVLENIPDLFFRRLVVYAPRPQISLHIVAKYVLNTALRRVGMYCRLIGLTAHPLRSHFSIVIIVLLMEDISSPWQRAPAFSEIVVGGGGGGGGRIFMCVLR